MRFSPELKRQLREAMLSYRAKKAEAEAQSPAIPLARFAEVTDLNATAIKGDYSPKRLPREIYQPKVGPEPRSLMTESEGSQHRAKSMVMASNSPGGISKSKARNEMLLSFLALLFIEFLEHL